MKMSSKEATTEDKIEKIDESMFLDILGISVRHNPFRVDQVSVVQPNHSKFSRQDILSSEKWKKDKEIIKKHFPNAEIVF